MLGNKYKTFVPSTSFDQEGEWVGTFDHKVATRKRKAEADAAAGKEKGKENVSAVGLQKPGLNFEPGQRKRVRRGSGCDNFECLL